MESREEFLGPRRVMIGSRPDGLGDRLRRSVSGDSIEGCGMVVRWWIGS